MRIIGAARRLQPRSLFCACFCLLACGCGVNLVPHTWRQISWNGVSATADLRPTSTDFTIFINPNQLDEELQIRMPDGRILKTSELNFETVWPYTFEARMGQKPPKKFPKFSKSYLVTFDRGFWSPPAGGYWFSFDNRRLTGFTPWGDSSVPEELRPAIGKTGGSKMYALPLSEPELTELFGPFESKRDTRVTLIGATVTNYPAGQGSPPY